MDSRKGARTTSRPMSRSRAAREAGLSVHQKRTALRIANIPDDVFEALIESDNPPTLTALAELGTQKREPSFDLKKTANPEDFKEWARLKRGVHILSETLNEIDLVSAIRGVSPAGRKQVLERLEIIASWLPALRWTLAEAEESTDGGGERPCHKKSRHGG